MGRPKFYYIDPPLQCSTIFFGSLVALKIITPVGFNTQDMIGSSPVLNLLNILTFSTHSCQYLTCEILESCYFQDWWNQNSCDEKIRENQQDTTQRIDAAKDVAMVTSRVTSLRMNDNRSKVEKQNAEPEIEEEPPFCLRTDG